MESNLNLTSNLPSERRSKTERGGETRGLIDRQKAEMGEREQRQGEWIVKGRQERRLKSCMRKQKIT